MQLEHPALARLTCAECKEWQIDEKTWTRATRGRDKQPFKRPPGTPTPCGVCPRRGPQHEAETRLSARNVETVELYYQFRALGWEGLPAPCRNDGLLKENLTLIDRIMRQHERTQLGESVALALLPIIAKGK